MLSSNYDFITFSSGSGDFCGNLYVWHVGQHTPLRKSSIPSSVRCLTWLDETSVLIGCMQGSLYLWNTTSSAVCSLVFQTVDGDSFFCDLVSDPLASKSFDTLFVRFVIVRRLRLSLEHSMAASSSSKYASQDTLWTTVSMKRSFRFNFRVTVSFRIVNNRLFLSLSCDRNHPDVLLRTPTCRGIARLIWLRLAPQYDVIFYRDLFFRTYIHTCVHTHT